MNEDWKNEIEKKWKFMTGTELISYIGSLLKEEIRQAKIDENKYWLLMQEDWVKGGVDEGVMVKNIKMRIIELSKLKEKQ